MKSMEKQMSEVMRGNFSNSDPNAPCYIQSYSYSCTNDGKNKPVIVEKNYEHKRMGDISETKGAIRDSRKNEERMRLQRTLGEKSRTITKKRVNNGNIESDEKFENIGESKVRSINIDEIEDFDNKWNAKAHETLNNHFLQYGNYSSILSC